MEIEINLSLKTFRIHPLKVILQQLTVPHFDARPVLCGKDALFLDVSHPYATTRLELTGVAPYAILCFNNDFKFAGATLNLQHHNSPFSMHTPYDKILFMRWPLDFDLNKVGSVSLRY